MRLSNSFPGQSLLPATYLQTFAFLEQGCQSSLAGAPPSLKLLLKFEVARQASSPSLGASVRAVQWADDAEQQLSRIDPSGCQLSADVRIFGAGLRKEPGRDPPHFHGYV